MRKRLFVLLVWFAFWPGVALGVLHALNRVPGAWSLGDGTYAGLLGANVYGTVVVFAGFGLGMALDRRRRQG